MQEKLIKGMHRVGIILNNYLNGASDAQVSQKINQTIELAHQKNKWFTEDNIRFALASWAELLEEEKILAFTKKYSFSNTNKTLGLILAGNIPMVGLHDVFCGLLAGWKLKIKLSSKDEDLIPMLMELIELNENIKLPITYVERLSDYDAVIATGSDTSSTYFEYYFRNTPHIIRKSRSSLAVLDGQESDEQLQKLGEDIFRYFGLGCRNVSLLCIPQSMELDRIFKNLLPWSEVIQHPAYANNYDYHKAIYLMNQDVFFDNNFVMMKESDSLSSPLSVIHFMRYDNLQEVKEYLQHHSENIQCVVSEMGEIPDGIPFGHSQKPTWENFADDIDSMEFLAK